ncbi:hypothetical protein WMY93_000730 [Mugilogobius chulae]|uniref:CCHC-type domain-containing protein n=1 Tax=Mugilogobius chulae TaxID=88201 RepID=A0AAW0Q389_9GOBI
MAEELEQLRARIQQWEADRNHLQQERDEANAGPSTGGLTVNNATGGAAPPSSTTTQFATLTVVEKQQEQLDKLSKVLAAMQQPSSPVSSVNNSVVCYRCQQSGHVARQCQTSFRSRAGCQSNPTQVFTNPHFGKLGPPNVKGQTLGGNGSGPGGFNSKVCYRCRRPGHIVRFCKVVRVRSKSVHSAKSLNVSATVRSQFCGHPKPQWIKSALEKKWVEPREPLCGGLAGPPMRTC